MGVLIITRMIYSDTLVFKRKINILKLHFFILSQFSCTKPVWNLRKTHILWGVNGFKQSICMGSGLEKIQQFELREQDVISFYNEMNKTIKGIQ